MSKKITVYDTTLRDGMQGIEVNYSLEDKIQISHKLDDLCVDYIEGGFPLSNEKEAAFFKRVKNEHFAHSKFVAFGSTRRAGIKAKDDANIKALLDAATETVIIVGKSWSSHVLHVLNTTCDENIEMIIDSITYLKSEGREVFFDLEHFFDGCKNDPEYAHKVLRAGSEAGAACVILCDTNGGTIPHEVEEIMDSIPKVSCQIGTHFHNDTGTAVANSLLSVKHGSTHIQGTINGWGERCGNTNLCTIIPNLALKMSLDTSCNPHLQKITSVSRFVSEKANIIPDKRYPYVGEAAFSHKAGQHADVLAKADYLMEHMQSSIVGNERKILLSELAGKSTIVDKMTKYGNFTKKSPEVSRLTQILKEKENYGYEYEAAEASFDILVLRQLGLYKPLFELNNYHLESFKTAENQSKTVGRVFIHIGKKDLMGAAVGVGPVETLDSAIRDAIRPVHSFIDTISLTDYKVRVLNPELASAAKVRVFITSSDHNGHSWDTVGVNENITEASWEALIDSFGYYYNAFVVDKK
jgi:2-isopropylmalate synthase